MYGHGIYSDALKRRPLKLYHKHVVPHRQGKKTLHNQTDFPLVIMPDKPPNPQRPTSHFKLFLIDGHSLIYRAYFAIRGLSTSQGLPTNAIYGFTNMLLKVVRERQPDYLAVVFDAKGPTQRHLDYEEYKADRPEMPDALQLQLPYIHQMVEAFRIPIILKEGYEADDLIGTLARGAERQGCEVTIVSGDKDMFQLITPHVRVYDTMKDRVYGLSDVQERFGVEPERVIEVMGLMGDSIDNIPGVPGIGEKTAVILIQRFGTIENLLSHLDQVERPKLRESLAAKASLARMSRQLATIQTECPIDLAIEKLKRCPPDTERLIHLFRELEFGSLLKSLSASGGVEPAVDQRPAIPILSPQDLDAMTAALKPAGRQSIHIWRTPSSGSVESMDEILGIGVGSETGAVYYIPLNHRYPDAPPQLDPGLVLGSLRDLLSPSESDAAYPLIIHDAKPFYLLNFKFQISNFKMPAWPVFDTQIASYLLHPNRRDHSLETVLLEQLGKPLNQGNPPPSTPIDQMLKPAAEVIHSLFALQDRMEPKLADQGLLDLYLQIELPLTEVLAEMESHGIRLDGAALNNLSKEMESQLGEMTGRIHRLAGGDFNIHSPKQLSHVLFEKLGLKPIKRKIGRASCRERV